MPGNWRNWCRFCAKSDFTEEDNAYEVESFENQLQIINNCFKISLRPLAGIRPLVCGECCGFLAKLGSFRDRCVKTDEMFRDIMQSSIQDLDLQSIRLKHQIDQEKIQFKAEIAEIVDDDVIVIKQEISTEDLTVEDSHKRSKKEKKKEKKRKRKASPERDEQADPKNKLFIVSYNEEKSYIAVTYKGKDVQYDDFVVKACSHLDLKEISIYDHNDIKIDRDAFVYVFKNHPPQYVVIKSKETSKTNPINVRVSATVSNSNSNETNLNPSCRQIHSASQVPLPANKEYIVQSFTISDQSTDSQELEIGDTIIVKQEECEKEALNKIRRDRFYTAQNGESSTDSMSSRIANGVPADGMNFLEELPEDTFIQPTPMNSILHQNWEDWTKDIGLYSQLNDSSNMSMGNNSSLPLANFGSMYSLNIQLRDILKCPDGRKIIQFYAARGSLDRTRRDSLIKLILDYADRHNMRLSCKILESISEEIQDIFPSEVKEYYYSPKGKFQKFYGGLLYARYHNRKRPAAKRKREPENITIQQIQHNPESQNMQELLAIKERLRSTEITEISPEIQSMWTATSSLRKKELQANKESFNEWPLYTHSHGYVFISEDFCNWYPNAESLDSKWSVFFKKIVPILQMQVKDRQNRQMLDDVIACVEGEETRQCSIIKILHSVLKPRCFVKKTDPTDPTKIKYIKPTIADAQENMLITLHSENEYQLRLDAFVKYLQETGRSFHPIIFRIIGIGYKVFCHGEIQFHVQTLKEAIDICFKSFHVLHGGQYPIESEIVWFFIQTYFYEIKTINDARVIGSCVDIVNQLKMGIES